MENDLCVQCGKESKRFCSNICEKCLNEELNAFAEKFSKSKYETPREMINAEIEREIKIC